MNWRRMLNSRNHGVLPKTEFPRKFKVTIEQIGIKVADNCKACGFIPYNPNRVLVKIPRNAPGGNDEDSKEQAWTRAITQHLNQLRQSRNAPPKRRKKVNVTPGKSSAIADMTINWLIEKSLRMSTIPPSLQKIANKKMRRPYNTGP